MMLTLRRRHPTAIFTTGAGNFSIWVNRFLRFRTLRAATRADRRLDGFRAAVLGRRETDASRSRHRLLYRRRRFPDERPGIRDRGAVRRQHHRRSSSTTASTARSACIRSANIPAASSARSSAIPISPLTRAPSAAMARRSTTTEEFEPAFERALASGLPGDLARKSRSGSDHADDDADRDPRGGAEARVGRLKRSCRIDLTAFAILARPAAWSPDLRRASPASPSA